MKSIFCVILAFFPDHPLPCTSQFVFRIKDLSRKPVSLNQTVTSDQGQYRPHKRARGVEEQLQKGALLHNVSKVVNREFRTAARGSPHTEQFESKINKI